MADEVVVVDGGESPVVEAEAASQTTPVDSETTWKARLAGKDRALTDAKKEAERLAKENADLSRWKAEKEQADLTEVQKLQQRIAALETERNTARQEATRLALRSEYPLPFDLLGDNAPLDPSALAELQTKLAALRGESEPEPPVDRNHPRRMTATPKTLDEKTVAELEGDLASFGNPFLG